MVSPATSIRTLSPSTSCAIVRRIVVVDEARLREAIVGVVSRERQIVEGAGATAVAGVLAGLLPLRDRRVAVVLSGANIDLAKLKDIL